MRAGGLRYRLVLLEPKPATDHMGAEAVTYTPTRTVWAERAKAAGSLSEEVGERFPSYTVEFNIRSAHPVLEGWRVRQLDGYLYNVANIVPHKDKGFNTLLCERVNE